MEKGLVLIVDCENVWYERFSQALPDYDVRSAFNYEEALEKIRDPYSSIDVIVSEVYLDKRDLSKKQGFDLIEAVWNTDWNRPARVILMAKAPNASDMGRYVKFYREHNRREEDDQRFLTKGSSIDEFQIDQFVTAVEKAAKDAQGERGKRKKKVFGITPFDAEFDEYNQVVKDILERNGLEYVQARDDKDFETLSIPEQIEEGIRESWFAIADLTHAKPNVYFEIGLAHAIGRNVILITRNIEDMTRRLEILRAHQYKDSMAGVRSLTSFINGKISEYEEKAKKTSAVELYPQSYTSLDPRLCLILTCIDPAKSADSEDTINQVIKPCLDPLGFTYRNACDIGIVSRKELSELIQCASMVIADLAGNDADVCYLAGLAYGRGKKPIVLARKGEAWPFDFNIFEPIIYSKGTINERDQAQKELNGRIVRQFIPRESHPPILVSSSTVTPNSGEKKFTVDVAILTILPEEYKAIYKRLNNTRFPDISGTNLYAWRVGDVACQAFAGVYSVALAKLPQAGNLTSQDAALDAVRTLNASYVFLVGVAGGIAPRTLGDVAVASYIRGYEYGKIDGGFQVRDLWLTPTDMGLFNGVPVFGDFCDWQSGISLDPPVICTPTHWTGEIASGEKVIDDLSDPFVQAVLAKFPKMIAFEMEGAGVANAMRIAQARGEVGRFIVIRGISDLPRKDDSGEDTHGTMVRDNWKPYAADVAAAFAIGYIADGLPERPLKVS